MMCATDKLPDYTLVRNGDDIGIRCNTCALTSWNKNDVNYLYCGKCDKFHQGPVMNIYTIYYHKEIELYVCRRYQIFRGVKEAIHDVTYGNVRKDIEPIRDEMRRLGLTMIPRDKSDAQDIIESWL